MLPCFILFWAALELALWGLWDLRPVGVCEWFGARTKGALGTTEYLYGNFDIIWDHFSRFSAPCHQHTPPRIPTHAPCHICSAP